MKKINCLKYFVILAILFFIVSSKSINAFSFQEVCQPVFKEFFNGETETSYKTIDIEFPPGGGLTCHTAWPCPLVSLPANATVYSFKVDIALTDPSEEIKTPYIWIPVTYLPDGVTENNKLKQVSTSNCSVFETYDVVSAPSRTYVIPGGDVWVASLTGTDVSKLSPLHGTAPAGAGAYCGDNFCQVDETIYYCPEDCSGKVCGATGNEDCRKYKVVGTFSPATAGGISGITGSTDITGNTVGDVWTGDCGNGNVSSLTDSGTVLGSIPMGVCPFGAAPDYFNRIWISNFTASSLQCINTSGIIFADVSYDVDVDTINLPYGIGVDDDSNVYVTCNDCGTVLKYLPGGGSCPNTLAPTTIYDTFVHDGPRGVAVDQKGYVWTANSHNNELYTFINPTTWYNVHLNTTDLRGVAIDFDGYGWVVSYDAGIAYKYEFDDVLNTHNLECQTPTLGGKSDSYSDMTGLRRTLKSLEVSGLISADVSSVGTFEICTDGATTCSNNAPCAAITAFLSTCVPDEIGNCAIPLEVSSEQAGKYTLKNLEVVYKVPVPVTTGGLMPCGRKWNDINTAWDDTASCNMCHSIILASSVINFLMGLIIPIFILALIVAGLIYVKTSGDLSLITAAKQNVNKILYGLVIIFIAWVIVNVMMALFGFTDPLGDGSWEMFSCNL